MIVTRIRLATAAALLAATLAATSTASAQQEESRNYPLGPIGGQFRVTPGSSAARVVALDSSAPGAAAGLQTGDYIYGAFGRRFTPTGQMHYGFTQDLGFAVDRAEAGDGVLPLMVLRPGVGGVVIDIDVGAAGAFGPVYPINSPKYDGFYESAVAYIHQTAMNANGNLGYFTGWMGLCLLGHPDWDKTDGPRPYRNSVNRIRNHVISNLQNANYAPNENRMILADGTVEDNPNHVGGMSNWQLGQMVMFLAEYYSKTGDTDVAPVLQRGAELCANSVQWWKQPALHSNGYSPEYNHVRGMVSHGGVTGDYIHLGWGGGINMCGAYSFNGLSFARRAGMDMEARPRDGHDFGFDPYPDTLAPVVPAHLKGYDHTLEEKFMYLWDFMGRRSMTRSNGNWGDGHIWYLAGQGSTTWDAGGRSPGTLLGMAMFEADGGVLSADDQDRVERIKGYITRAYMWQQEAHAYCVGAQAYQAMAAPFLSDRQLRYFMDNWRFYFALSRTHDDGFRYFRARHTNDSYLNETHCAAINVALPHAIANGRLNLLPGYNTDRLVVRFDNPEMTWPSLAARQVRRESGSVPMPFAIVDGFGEPVDDAAVTAVWSGPGEVIEGSFGAATSHTDEAIAIYNQNNPPDQAGLPSNGHGNYRGFGFRPDDAAFSVEGGEVGTGSLLLGSMTIRRSGSGGALGAGAVRAKIYSSRVPGTATWVGDSMNTVNLNGGISEANVTFLFDSLPMSPQTTYYVYFADTAGNLDPSAVTWRNGRLRVSNHSAHTYPSGNLINESWGNQDTAFDALLSADFVARTYSAPATGEDDLVFPGEGTWSVLLTVSDGSRVVEEPVVVVIEGASPEPPPMAILSHPQDVETTLGGSATLSISTTGPSPSLYQWRRNGHPIGAPTTSPTLTLANVSGGVEGVYDCVFTTESGTLTSQPATIAITDAGALVTGGLWREVYTGIGGTQVANLTAANKFPYFADASGVIPSAASPSNFADNFGERWTGWLVPVVSGRYRFYLASDDDSELWLGTDERPESAVRRLQLFGWTGEKQWSSRSPSQWIDLEAGKRYYFEVLHKEGGGADHCAVAWQREGQPAPSNGADEIPGEYFIHRTGGLFPDTILANSPPSFTQETYHFPPAMSLVAYTGSVAGLAIDPDEGDVITYSLLAGPSWLVVDPDGTLTGTPGQNAAGENVFTIQASDSGNLTDTAALVIHVASADFYFDLNGPDPGSGAEDGGVWDGSAQWSSDPDGESGVFEWVDGANAVFAAGEDAAGQYTITLDGVKNIGGFTARTGTPVLVDGGLVPDAGDTRFEVLTSGGRIDSVISGAGRGMLKTGPGTLVLGGSNTFTGNLRVAGGVLELAASGKLYNGGFNNNAVITVESGATWRVPNYSYGGVGQLADYRQRRVLDGGAIEVTGGSHGSGQDFTVTENGGIFRYTATGQTLTLSGNNNTNIRIDGLLVFDTIGHISVTGSSSIIEGSGALSKIGPGTLILGNSANSFAGDLVVGQGLLRATAPSGSAANSSLGAKSGGRSIHAISPGTMEWTSNNILGGGGMSAADLPTVVLEGATLTTTRFNALGHVTLAGGTLINANTTDPATYDGWQFIGGITAVGTDPSTIVSTTDRGNHLRGNGTTAFDVADPAGLLTIASALRNGSNDYPGTAALRKSGPGTLVLAAANAYSGITSVDAGTLHLTGSLAAPATVAHGATLSGDGTVNASVTVDSGGTLTASAGEVLTTGPLSLSAGATLVVTLSEEVPGRVHVAGNIDIGGAVLAAQSLPEAGVPVTILSYTGVRDGTFDGEPASLPPGWVVEYDDAAKEIRLAPESEVPQPGTYAAWIAGFETGGQAGPLDDPDGDGVPNGLEFVLHGGDPTQPGSAEPIGIVTNEHGGLSLAFRRAARSRGADDFELHIEFSDDLVHWPEESRLAVGEDTATSGPGVLVEAHDDFDEIRFVLPDNAIRRFARLRVIFP